MAQLKDNLEIANLIAEEAFKDKVDKAGKPYIEHLIRVSQRSREYNYNMRIIGLLHDLFEDCPKWKPEHLKPFFSHYIIDAIVALTRKQGESYEQFINRVSENTFATQVKLYDLEDNMNILRLNEITKEDFERLKKYHTAHKKLSSVLSNNP